ncbi:MAG: VOC family protein [Nodosilinea sp.]
MDSTAILFHLSFPVADISTAKSFYVDGLGCEPGRENTSSLILNLRGHQLVAHTTRDLKSQEGIYPRHFGLVFLAESDWEDLLRRSKEQSLTFYQGEKRRFPDTVLEHRTFFLQDPFHNLLEFKYYRHPSAIFGETDYNRVGDTQ